MHDCANHTNYKYILLLVESVIQRLYEILYVY